MKIKKSYFFPLLCILLTACNGTSSQDNDVPVEFELIEERSKIVQNDNYRNCVHSFYDNTYNYYVFKMGRIHDTPLEHTSSYFYYNANLNEYTHKFVTTTVESESIQQTTSNTFQENTSYTNTQSFNVGVSFPIKMVLVTAGVEASWSQSGSTNVSFTDSYAYASETSRTTTHEVEFSLKGCEYGYYRYALIGAVDVYLTILQSRDDAKELYPYYLTNVRLSGYAMNYAKTSEELFDDESDGEFEFDMSIIDSLDEPSVYYNTSGSLYSLELTDLIKSCNQDNGYNSDNPDGDERKKWEALNAKDLSTLKINGCRVVDEDTNTYEIVNKDAFDLYFVTKRKPYDMSPAENNPHSGSNCFHLEVSNDDSRYITGVGDLVKEVDRGTVAYKYYYTDGSSSADWNLTYNIYDGIQDVGERVNFFRHGDNFGNERDNFINSKEISKLEIIYVYEIAHRVKGFMGIESWGGWSNWRVDLTLNFTN